MTTGVSWLRPNSVSKCVSSGQINCGPSADGISDPAGSVFAFAYILSIAGRLVVQIQSCHRFLRPEYAAVPNRLSFGVSAGQRTSKLPSCLRRSPVAESKIPSFSANSLPIADPRPLWIFGSIQLMITFLQCYKVYESSGRETDADCRDLLLQHKLPH